MASKKKSGGVSTISKVATLPVSLIRDAVGKLFGGGGGEADITNGPVNKSTIDQAAKGSGKLSNPDAQFDVSYGVGGKRGVTPSTTDTGNAFDPGNSPPYQPTSPATPVADLLGSEVGPLLNQIQFAQLIGPFLQPNAGTNTPPGTDSWNAATPGQKQFASQIGPYMQSSAQGITGGINKAADNFQQQFSQAGQGLSEGLMSQLSGQAGQVSDATHGLANATGTSIAATLPYQLLMQLVGTLQDTHSKAVQQDIDQKIQLAVANALLSKGSSGTSTTASLLGDTKFGPDGSTQQTQQPQQSPQEAVKAGLKDQAQKKLGI